MYASVPAIIAECPLDDYYLGAMACATYMRLDLDYDTLGTPLSHPLAHVHSGDDDAPRFALDGGDCGNVLVDYLELIYRTFVPDKWVEWARDEWLSANHEQERGQQFDRIVLAFKEQKFEMLREDVKVVAEVKNSLRKCKDSLFKEHMYGEDRLILEYPESRRSVAENREE